MFPDQLKVEKWMTRVKSHKNIPHHIRSHKMLPLSKSMNYNYSWCAQWTFLKLEAFHQQMYNFDLDLCGTFTHNPTTYHFHKHFQKVPQMVFSKSHKRKSHNILFVLPSVRLSARLSVTPFWLSSHHRIIMKFSGVITTDQGNVHAKGRDQRSRSHGSKNSRISPKLGVSGLFTQVLIHQCLRNNAQSLK